MEPFWGLRMLENHFWIADAGDSSASDGEYKSACDLLRLCFADFERISPLTPSNVLCLHAFQKGKI